MKKTPAPPPPPPFTLRLRHRKQLELEALARRPPLSLASYLQHLIDTHPERKKPH